MKAEKCQKIKRKLLMASMVAEGAFVETFAKFPLCKNLFRLGEKAKASG